ncbi:MAG: hypothetical protein A2Z98_03200, partial [Spirochaetes bacterium GWB1_27_13]
MFVKDFAKTAIIYNNEEISYKKLIVEITRYSELYTIDKGAMVGIFAENRPEWIYAFFSVWYNGGTNVAIDFMASPEEISYIIDDCTPQLIFTSAENKPALTNAISLSKHKPKILVFEEMVFSDVIKKEEVKNDDNDVAVIIYTSGTTGNPKGVMLTHKNLLTNIVGINALNIMNSADIFAVILPFHHIYPLTGTVLFPFWLGVTIVIVEKLSSDVILSTFQKYKMTILFGIPRLYNLFHKAIMDKINSKGITRLFFALCKLIRNKKFSRIIFGKVHKLFGGKIRYFLTGGSKVKDQVMEDFGVLGFSMTEGYGLSETSPLNTANNTHSVFRKGSIGKPLCNVEVKIVDDEIVVKGDHVMVGYYNKQTETEAVIKDGWFYTGDEGYIDNDGYIFITGRKKELLVLENGKKVNPEEIENKIMELNPDLIKEIGVFAKDDKIFALILPNIDELKKMNIVNIFETMKWQVLDQYNKMARDFKKIFNFKIVTDELPKTRIGKLKRFAFSQIFTQDEKKEVKHEIDLDFEEYSLIKNYLAHAVKKEVYPESHIELDLGLDSIEKVEFISFLEHSFGITVTTEDIASHPLVKEIALYMQEKKTKIEAEETGWDKILENIETVKIKSKPFFSFLTKFFLWLPFKVYYRLKVKGLNTMPKPPYIITPNHQSFVDAFLINAGLKNRFLKDTFFLANEKHFKHKVGRFITNSSNIITVNINTNLKMSLQKIALVLKNNKNVVIFPEGARTRDGNLMEFKKTFAILAKVLNVP